MADKMVCMLYCDRNGALLEMNELQAIGCNGYQIEPDCEWSDFPSGGELVQLTGRLPLGYNPTTAEVEALENATAVAAILPVGYTRTLLPAYEMDNSQELPLFGYTAVGSVDGHLKVAAVKTDEDLKWNPLYYNTSDLSQLVQQRRKVFPDNRILAQLAKCALEYHCLTAQNMFYQRWEAGIPVSPVCNCNCLGCISLQPAECCPSPQSRIDFIPTASEVYELAAAHLAEAADGIISFGQGCEGEPSLQYKLLADAIREIRSRTVKGTININTNAGNVTAIQTLVDAGLDSMRVSLFSAVPKNYAWYHRPVGYQLADVIRSIRYATDHNITVALNLLLFPGFTNQVPESEALDQLIAETGIHQVQLRNLNLDPEKLSCLLHDEELPTISDWIEGLVQQFPNLRIGNYSRPVR